MARSSHDDGGCMLCCPRLLVVHTVMRTSLPVISTWVCSCVPLMRQHNCLSLALLLSKLLHWVIPSCWSACRLHYWKSGVCFKRATPMVSSAAVMAPVLGSPCCCFWSAAAPAAGGAAAATELGSCVGGSTDNCDYLQCAFVVASLLNQSGPGSA